MVISNQFKYSCGEKENLMKSKFVKVCALLAVPAVLIGASACGKDVGENKSYVLQDDGVYPAVSAAYEEDSKAAIARWQSASGAEKAEVAKSVAAELFAYGCYNEEYIDKYVYFSNQTGSTNLGNGSGEATHQNYKLIIRESENSPGYKYHYTLKNVTNATGTLSTILNLPIINQVLVQAKLRFVEDTNKLYRFEGENIRYAEGHGADSEQPLLTCDWETGTDWGTDDPPIVKREGDKLTLDGIEEDIIQIAEGNGDEPVIHGNVNILAENIVKSASITEGKADGHSVYEVTMELDVDVANADGASVAMLKNANSASECGWATDENGSGPVITYQIWDNGLLKYYKIDETWEGKIKVLLLSYSGGADTETEVWYSYSQKDTDMTEKLAMLEEAKKQHG